MVGMCRLQSLRIGVAGRRMGRVASGNVAERCWENLWKTLIGFGDSDGGGRGGSDLDSDVDMTRALGSNGGVQYRKIRRRKKSKRKLS